MIYPKGFLLNGICAGIKKTNVLDLGIVYSEAPCEYAGVFTVNKVQAAPVKICKARLKNPIHGIVVNSKNANSFTGKQGLAHGLEMAQLVENEFSLAEGSVLVSSTGVIGEYLPMDKIRSGIHDLCQTIKQNAIKPENFAQSILTTDTKPKEMSRQFDINGKTVTIYGCCKGSGMIYPNMATMLAFVVTDINISRRLLSKALRSANDLSFNAISVDGDMSTNDSVLLLSNGQANNDLIDVEGDDFEAFQKALRELCLFLAQEIVRDGEGATKFITVAVKGAMSQEDANKCAAHISNSLLVKTAFFGQDANWGRFVYAIGASGAEIDEERLDISLGNIVLVKSGERTQFSNEEANAYMKNHELHLEVHLNMGAFFKTMYTTDLSYDYVKINADYRT